MVWTCASRRCPCCALPWRWCRRSLSCSTAPSAPIWTHRCGDRRACALVCWEGRWQDHGRTLVACGWCVQLRPPPPHTHTDPRHTDPRHTDHSPAPLARLAARSVVRPGPLPNLVARCFWVAFQLTAAAVTPRRVCAQSSSCWLRWRRWGWRRPRKTPGAWMLAWTPQLPSSARARSRCCAWLELCCAIDRCWCGQGDIWERRGHVGRETTGNAEGMWAGCLQQQQRWRALLGSPLFTGPSRCADPSHAPPGNADLGRGECIRGHAHRGGHGRCGGRLRGGTAGSGDLPTTHAAGHRAQVSDDVMAAPHPGMTRLQGPWIKCPCPSLEPHPPARDADCRLQGPRTTCGSRSPLTSPTRLCLMPPAGWRACCPWTKWWSWMAAWWWRRAALARWQRRVGTLLACWQLRRVAKHPKRMISSWVLQRSGRVAHQGSRWRRRRPPTRCCGACWCEGPSCVRRSGGAGL